MKPWAGTALSRPENGPDPTFRQVVMRGDLRKTQSGLEVHHVNNKKEKLKLKKYNCKL